MSKKDWNKVCLQVKLGGLVDDELYYLECGAWIVNGTT
jgi:hypothetical protein